MTATADIARTPLHDWHAEHGGRLVDFAGWAMPVQYSSIIEEHQATRKSIGLFDVSHMGRLLINGPQAMPFLESLLTRRVDGMTAGQARYSLMCNEQGGILDDVLVYRVSLSGEDNAVAEKAGLDQGMSGYGLVVNADNRTKIVDWLKQHATQFEVTLQDVTHDYAMIAVQGPQAITMVNPLIEHELTSLRYYTGVMTRLGDVPCYVSRTGYTGEDGCELMCPSAAAESIWKQLITLAEAHDGRAVGLAARDTLRLEAGMPLYGHELSESINPIQAGLSFAVNLHDREFAGREALLAASKDAAQPVRVGLQMSGKRPPREGYRVLQGDEEVGVVTSGTFSPTFERPLAMAYVKPSAAGVGERLAIDVRGSELPATVAPLPFYQRGN